MSLLGSLDGQGPCNGGHGDAFCSLLLYVLVVVAAAWRQSESPNDPRSGTATRNASGCLGIVQGTPVALAGCTATESAPGNAEYRRAANSRR